MNIPTILICWLLVAVSERTQDTTFDLLPGRTYEAVILPAEVANDSGYFKHDTGFWTPSEADVAKAEVRITEVMEASTNFTFHYWFTNNTTFVRQYVGILNKDRKQIYCGAVDKKLVSRSRDKLRWRREFMKPFDVGNAAWEAVYDVEGDRIETFD